MQNLPFMRKILLKALIRMLEQEGFQITAGLADIPTAFMAQYGGVETDGGYFGRVRCTAFKPEAGCNHQEELVPGRAGHGCGS